MAPGADKPYLAPDKDDKYMAYIRVADENILANEILVLSWKKRRNPQGVLLKVSEPVERLFSWLDAHDYITPRQFCAVARINYYTARNIISDLLAMDMLEYALRDKRLVYRSQERPAID